jgi:NTE family protein
VESLQARAGFLRGVPVFAGLTQDAIEAIANRAEEIRVAAGAWVVREGEPAEGLYVLRAGRLEVVREAGDVDVAIRVLGPGAVLGELAVLTNSVRSASVRARRDSALLKVSSQAFLELLEHDAPFAIGLTRALAEQLQASRGIAPPRDPVPPVIAVVDDSASLAAELARALERFGTVKLLDAREAGEAASFGEALDRFERAADRVVLAAGAGAGDPAWRSFCLRQADRVVVVADARVRPGPAAAELRGADLAMPSTQPGLSRWIDAIDPRAVHLLDGAAAVELLARKLAGQSTGIVLSGGGARGFAHIGVLAELERAGLRPDRVGGCSMGAIVGGLYASGRDPEEIARLLHAEFVERNPLNDYTLPLAALVRGRKATAMLERLFGDRRIEELEREYFCVSCDLVTSELVVHRRGPLAEAVSASASLPGIAPPLSAGERLLVDGGVLNNLPVEAMAARGDGPVIAVDVSARYQPPAQRENGSPRRPRIRRFSSGLRHALVGWDTPLPNLKETLTRAIVLGSADTTEAAERHAHLVIAPAVQDVDLMEFARIEDIRAEGAVAARAVLDELPPELAAHP